MTTAVQAQERINKLREQLAVEEAKLATFNQLTEAQRLATEIHQRTCHLDHMERCGWDYDNWTDPARGRTRQRYLEKAEKALQVATYDKIVEIIEIIR